MISLFKINDPYRLILVLLILILLRLPYLIPGPVRSIPQLEWQVLGEKMASGAELYVDVYHPTGPVPSGIYWIFSKLFGRNLLPWNLTALLLIFFQASMLSFLMINHRAFNQNTFIPSLIFVILMGFFPDSAQLSPQLISMTFMIFGIDLVFRHIEARQKADWIMMYAGLAFGMAGLSYLPSSLFTLSTLITFLLFTNTPPRRYFLLLYGFIMPFAVTWLYFFWRNQSALFFTNFFWPVFHETPYRLYSFSGLLLLIAGPLGFLLISWYRILTGANLISLQVTLQNYMALIFLTGIAVVGLGYYYSPHSLIILFIPLSFFIAQLFMMIRRKWLAEIVFLVFLVATLANGYGSYFRYFKLNAELDARKIIPHPCPYDSLVAGKKVFWAGNHPEVYRSARLATPWLSWTLSKKFLENPDNPDILIRVTQQMLNDLPDIIIDDQGIIKHIFELSPVLEEKYRRTEAANIYYLKNS